MVVSASSPNLLLRLDCLSESRGSFSIDYCLGKAEILCGASMYFGDIVLSVPLGYFYILSLYSLNLLALSLEESLFEFILYVLNLKLFEFL